MSFWTKKYFDFYLLCYALYAYLNKGIAYSFLVEALLGIGLLVVMFRFKQLEIPKERVVILLIIFLGINLIYMGRGFTQYGIINVIRDSFLINYALFIAILFLFRQHTNYLLKGIFKIYALYPVIQLIHFLILSYLPHADEFMPFGNISLLHYKYGDMAVHLFICTLLMVTGKIQLPFRFTVLNYILIGYLFLVASTFSRAGMVCFGMSGLLFFFTLSDLNLKKQLLYYLRFVPIFLLVAIPLYQLTKTKENFQGRKTGITQLTENITSLTATEKGSTQSDNNVWRLVWWGKIIEYTFGGQYFMLGKGLGMSLAVDDDIDPSTSDGELRSPHNFHLNLLARFGVPFFLAWLYWIFLHLQFFKRRVLSPDAHWLLCIFFIFLVNASFDVYLEGPMGAFPFWTITGLLYIELFFTPHSKIRSA
ncbi:MAG: hypothetical protein K2X26_07075 [Chitinophagaceae bacterium]|nr:hypothetical protein [Chitinophagaceae bacterium]